MKHLIGSVEGGATLRTNVVASSPPPARLRAGALALPTPPQGGSFSRFLTRDLGLFQERGERFEGDVEGRFLVPFGVKLR